MSPEERRRWKKLLNTPSARVQIPKGTIRQFGRLRGAVREGSASGGITIPETTPASETNLGRMATALSGVSGLFAQYNDFLFKKDEIAQRGKALEHQKFTEGQKLLQVNQSIAAMGSASQGLDERLKQQEIRNDEIALHNLDLYQNELVGAMSEDQLTALAKDIQEQGKLAEEGIEKGEQKISVAQGFPPIRDDILRDVRMGRLTGAKLAPVLEKAIAKRWEEKLKKIGNRETAPIHSDEEAREAVANWIKEWLEEKEIDPSSDVAWGLRRTTQKHFLETLNSYAEGLVKASEKRENDDTGLTFSDWKDDVNPSAFSPDDDDTTHNTVPATPEESAALIKALGDLTPQQEAAVNRELKKEGSELYNVVDALLNPDITPEDPEEDPEGIGTIGPTSAEIRRGISLAIQAVEKFKGDEELADITNSVAWKANYAPRPQDVQQSILDKGADHAISAGRVSIQRYLITLDDALEASTWDERNGMDHPVGHDIRNKLMAALQAAEKREAVASEARQRTLNSKRNALALAMTQWSTKEDLKARRLMLAGLEGNMTNEEVEEKFTEWATRDGIPSPFLESYLTPLKGLGPAELVEEVLKMTTAMINMENNQESLALEFTHGKSWYSDPSSEVSMAYEVKEWLKARPPNSEAWKYTLNTLLSGQKDEIVNADNWADVVALSPVGMKELNSVIEGIRRDQADLAQGVSIAAQENEWTVEEAEDEMKKRMITLMESVPKRLDEWANARTEADKELREERKTLKEHQAAYFLRLEEEREREQEVAKGLFREKQDALHVDTDGDGEPDTVVPVYGGPMTEKDKQLRRQKGTEFLSLKRWESRTGPRTQPAQVFDGRTLEDVYWRGPMSLQPPAPMADPNMLIMSIKTALPSRFDPTLGKREAKELLTEQLPLEDPDAFEYLSMRYQADVGSEEANKLPADEQRTNIKNYLKEWESYRKALNGRVQDYMVLGPNPLGTRDIKTVNKQLGAPFMSQGRQLQQQVSRLNSGRVDGLRWLLGARSTGQITYDNMQAEAIEDLKPLVYDMAQSIEEKYKRFVTAPELIRVLDRSTKNAAYAGRAGIKQPMLLVADLEDVMLEAPTSEFRLATRRKNGLHSALHPKYIEMNQPLLMGLMYQEGDRSGGKPVPAGLQNRPLSRKEASIKLGGMSDSQMDRIAVAFGFTDDKGKGDWDALYASQMEKDVYKAMRKLGTLGK